MYLGIINEVMRDHRICMLPTAFNTVRNLILSNIDTRAGSLHVEKAPVAERLAVTLSSHDAAVLGCITPTSSPSPAPVPTAPVPDASTSASDGGDPSPSPSDPASPAPATDSTPSGFVSLIHLQGPMTRGGAECSYGSREIRDYIIDSASDPDCVGHIILTDTPGGMCSCLPDFRMAVNEAHLHGQKVVMLIDGIAASAGAFVGAMCDGIYYTNDKDEIGSIGMYASFFTLADGAENKITSEIYHEIYASACTDKNAWQRQASQGDTEQLQTEINHDLDLLIADLSADRPSILDEQKTGKMYPVADVVGSLVDGKSTLAELAAMLISDYQARGGAPLPVKMGATPAPAPAASPADSAPAPDASASGTAPAQHCAGSSSTAPNPNTTMKQYPTISSALQMGEAIIESDTENLLTLQPQEADALEAVLNERNAQIASLSAALTAARDAQHAAEQALAAAQTDAAAQVEAAVAAQQQAEQALADLQATTAQAEAEHAAAIASNNAAIESLNQQLAESQQAVADNQQTIADLRSENERLASSQGAPINAGAEPQADNNPMPQAARILSKEETEALLRAQYGH